MIIEDMFFWLYKKEPVIVVSKWMQEYALSRKFTKVQIIRNGVHIPAQKQKTYKKQMVLFLGRTEHRKGFDLFLEAAKKCTTKAEFILAGPKYSQKDIAQIQEAGCTYLGYVDEKRKQELLRQAWVVVVPSRLEGYSITVLEANAQGTFVIGTDVAGLKESIQHQYNGVRVSLDSQAIATTIDEWMDVKKLKTQENSCREWAKKHSWDLAAKKTQKLLELTQNQIPFYK
jgi:glycosyltransferase involved in cell wall biosynthesis